MGLAWALPLAEIAAAQASPVFRTTAVRDVPLKNLADWILRSPHAEKMTSQEGVLTAQVVQRQEGPAQRTIYVQRHSTGQVDIVFIVVTESEARAYIGQVRMRSIIWIPLVLLWAVPRASAGG